MDRKTQIKKIAKNYILIPGAIGVAIGAAYVITTRHASKTDFTSYGWDEKSGDFLIVINGNLHRFLSKTSS